MLNQIKEAHELGVLDGVTTYPSLMAKEGITGHDNMINHYKAICEIVNCAKIGAHVITGPLSAIEGLFKHPLTDNGLVQFLADHAKAASK